jgi:hypothetical protein
MCIYKYMGSLENTKKPSINDDKFTMALVGHFCSGLWHQATLPLTWYFLTKNNQKKKRVIMSVMLFWIVTLCELPWRYYFGGTHCLHFHILNIYTMTFWFNFIVILSVTFITCVALTLFLFTLWIQYYLDSISFNGNIFLNFWLQKVGSHI